jgi:hypothetical protein
MIGASGDFDIQNIEDSGPEGTIISNDFGRVFGAEDGWSEEMQNIGNFEFAGFEGARRVRHSFFRKSPMAGVDYSMGHEHPLSGFGSVQMGDGQMGIDFAKIAADLKAQANLELAKAKTQLTTQVKSQVGTAVAKAANTILARPDIQQAMVAQGKEAAVQNIAQDIAKQITEKGAQTIETVKKYSIPLMAIGGLGLAYLIFRKKRA